MAWHGMSAELTTSGRFSLPSTEKPKLSLVELVAPVADDLLLLNDNLQKVSPIFIEACGVM